MSVTSDLSGPKGRLRRLPPTSVADRRLPALARAGMIAAVATGLGVLVPRIGGPIIALALGTAVSMVLPAGRLQSGLGSISRSALKLAIVLLGATISLTEVLRVGGASLPVMLGSLSVSLLSAAVVGQRLGVPANLRVLVGVGTGICGASAIAAVSGVIDADAREIRYAISTIFVFNLAAVVIFPALGHLTGMDSRQFGLWSGTAVNDTSSVLAAGYAYSHAAGTYALIVKLTRTTMIIPITLFLAAATLRRQRAGALSALEGDPGAEVSVAGTASLAGGKPRVPLRRLIPWFLVWFAAASAADSLGLFSVAARGALSHAGLGLTTLALAAVGLSINLRELRETGPRPLILGACVWGAVALSSLGLQVLTGAG